MPARLRRERYEIPGDDWSDWNQAMVPYRKLDHSTRRQNGSGYKIKNLTVPDGDLCGIYEWLARGDGRASVVYVGSTCREKKGALRVRILEYCNGGSHKSRLINKALDKKYELWFRVKPTRSKRKAETEENKLLDKYDYAWNKRNNGRRRNILH